MPSRGEAHNTQTMRIDAVLLGMRADKAHCSPPIVDLYGIVIRSDPIVEDEGRHPLLVKPLSDLEALKSDTDVLVPAPWDYQNCRICGTGRRQESVHPRFVEFTVAQRSRRSAAPERCGWITRIRRRSLRMEWIGKIQQKERGA